MKLKYILGLILILALAILYYRFNPGVYTFFPECPFHKYLHLDCPGCGSQRAVHALLHGNVLIALDYNALLVLSLPLLLIHLLYRVVGFLKKKDLKWDIWHKPATPRIVLAIVLIFWIVRNIPVAPFTYLAS